MVRSGKGAPAVRDLQGSAPSLFIIRLSWAARIAWFLVVVALSIFLMLATKWFIAPILIYLLWKFIWLHSTGLLLMQRTRSALKLIPKW